MKSQSLGIIKTELEQGLVHIKEAVRLSEVTKNDTSCFSSVFVSINLVQNFLDTLVTTSLISNDNQANYLKEGNTGWNPMRSKFPSITRYNELSSETQQGTHQDNVDFNYFFLKSSSQTKPMIREGRMKCILCNVNCNSLSQWKQHLNGHRHKAKLADEQFSQKMNLRWRGKNNGGVYRKAAQKPSTLYEKSFGIVEYRRPYRRRQKMEDLKIENRAANGKRQQVSSIKCEICDVTHNGM